MAIHADVRGGLAADVSTTQKYPLGKVLKGEEGKEYRYVQNKSLAAAIGSVLSHASGQTAGSAPNWQVTPDVSASFTVGTTRGSGIAIGTIAVDSYGWMQTKGYCQVETDGNVQVGHMLVRSGTDHVAEPVTAGQEHNVFGQAISNDSGTSVFADVNFG